jgi:glycosyltransferase involved in cell wall biosynthesis
MERVLPQAHGIRVVSKRVKDSVCARFNNRIVDPVIIPIAMSSSVPERVPMPGTVSPFTIIAVSRLEAEKRLEDVIDALVTVHKRHPEVGLVIVGSGRRERFLRAHAKSRGVAGAVTFLGARDDARGLMKSAQAFIQASAYEGYGVTLLEAALAEIPIITTDVGIVGDVLKSDVDTLVAPVGSVPTLIMHIETLVRDPQKRIMLTLNAARAAKEHLARTGDAPALIIKNLQAV